MELKIKNSLKWKVNKVKKMTYEREHRKSLNRLRLFSTSDYTLRPGFFQTNSQSFVALLWNVWYHCDTSYYQKLTFCFILLIYYEMMSYSTIECEGFDDKCLWKNFYENEFMRSSVILIFCLATLFVVLLNPSNFLITSTWSLLDGFSHLQVSRIDKRDSARNHVPKEFLGRLLV